MKKSIEKSKKDLLSDVTKLHHEVCENFEKSLKNNADSKKILAESKQKLNEAKSYYNKSALLHAVMFFVYLLLTLYNQGYF